jgi:hypothetical protein
MFQDHRHKRLRNLAQVMLHMKQPTKYLEEVPVYLEPVPSTFWFGAHVNVLNVHKFACSGLYVLAPECILSAS